jgi:hypothetical protein
MNRHLIRRPKADTRLIFITTGPDDEDKPRRVPPQSVLDRIVNAAEILEENK